MTEQLTHPGPWRVDETDPNLVVDRHGNGVVIAHDDATALRIASSVNESEHPALRALRDEIEAAVEHGYTEGDVNHHVQPIIGQLRLIVERNRQHGGTAVQVDLKQMEGWIDKLSRATNAETAWLHAKVEQ